MTNDDGAARLLRARRTLAFSGGWSVAELAEVDVLEEARSLAHDLAFLIGYELGEAADQWEDDPTSPADEADFGDALTNGWSYQQGPAEEVETCAAAGCSTSLEDGEGYDGLCGDHADQEENEHAR